MKKNKIKNLALCGGGFYGYAEVGALMELEKYKEYFDITEIRGASVGSLVSTLYAVGYSPEELTKIMFDLNFEELIKDTRLPYLKFYDKLGMYDATGLEDRIEKLIQEKTHIKFCTFSQIKKNLLIVSTNLNYQRARFFSKEHSPDMVISKAVRMSIGYPLIMSPVLFEGDLYGDGGEFMNYPITTFDNLEETIGITFAGYHENLNGTLKNRMEIKTIYDYLRSLALTMSRATYVSQITSAFLERSIIVQITEDISSMQFNLTNEQKHFIYNCGVKAVQDQIHKILGLEKSSCILNDQQIVNIANDIEHDILNDQQIVNIANDIEHDIVNDQQIIDTTKNDDLVSYLDRSSSTKDTTSQIELLSKEIIESTIRHIIHDLSFENDSLNHINDASSIDHTNIEK